VSILLKLGLGVYSLAYHSRSTKYKPKESICNANEGLSKWEIDEWMKEWKHKLITELMKVLLYGSSPRHINTYL